MKKYLFAFLALSVAVAEAQITPQEPFDVTLKVNFVRTFLPSRPYTDPLLVRANTSVAEVGQSTQYVDGLGRPIQTIVKKGSPLQKDLVTAHVYDAIGRESYQYLPFTSVVAETGDQIDDGKFKLNPLQQQSAFYDAELAGQNQTYYYGQTNYESSPLNRPSAVYAPGNNWVGTAEDATEANRHGNEMIYAVNTAIDNVQKWVVTDGSPGTFGSYTASAYGVGELYKIISENEEGKQVIEFKDKEGKVVLKKVMLTAAKDPGAGSAYTGWLSAYYIYDNRDLLRCVIQPKGVDAIWTGSAVTDPLPASILNEHCFRYEYDTEARMIMKKVPGAGATEMVYDQRDRLIMVREARLSAPGNSYWTVNKYDALDRLLTIGLIKSDVGRAAHQSSSDADINYPTVAAADVMQTNYYDNYDWVTATPQPGVGKTILTNNYVSAFFNMTFNTAPEYAQPIVADYVNIRGKPTGSKVRVLGTSTYLYSAIFYDDKGRVIQTRSGNITGAPQNTTTQYDFAGKPLRVLQVREKWGPTSQYVKVLTKFSYDHNGRVLSIKKRVGYSGVERTIVTNEYDERGNLKKKTLPNNLEVQNFEYNIRGWLLGNNRNYVKGTSTNKFGYELGYDNNQSIITGKNYTTPQFSGNIGGLMWKSAGDNQVRSYDFSYDAASRLTNADFNQYTSGSFNKTGGLDFSASGITYDGNGNILTMQHKGWKNTSSTTIDNLTYNYLDAGNSNKLAKVTDAATDPNTRLGDFKDGSGSGDDYTYDLGGNLITDGNKAISSILYTHLNMPYEINITGKGKISYAYDNMGNKLKKTVVDNTTVPATTTTWLYIDGVVCKNDTIQFFEHEEGRARFDGAQLAGEAKDFQFDYFLKDHLGNVRMVLTEEKDTAFYPTATIEDATVAEETVYYDIKTSQVKLVSQVAGASSNTSLAAKFYKVNGTVAGQQTGLGMVLKVMSGDKVGIRAESYYDIGGGSGSSTAIPLTDLLAAFAGSGAVAGKGLTTTQISGLGSNTASLNNMLPTSSGSTIANAHLCWVLFDEQLKYVSSGVDQVQNNGGFKNHIQFINSPVLVNTSGYLYIFVSNKSNLDVFFDNLAVTHYKGPILEETHYYPFGLTMAGISSRALGKLENKKRFNGIEQTTELDLNQYDAFYRTMDPQIGRWWQIDPKPTDWESPYAAMGNNPILNMDFWGDSISPSRTKGMNFFVTANKELRKKDIQDHRPVKGILKGIRGFFSSAYAIDNTKARIKSALSLGKMKVISAGNAQEATDKIINKLGNKGYVKNLTVDYHADNFGPDAPPGSPTTLSNSTTELNRLANGYAGDATTVYLGQCWAGGNTALGQPDYTGMISEALDGATVYGNQAAASSISFALRSNFVGVIPEAYSKSPENRASVGKHTVTGRDPSTGGISTRVTTRTVSISNSGEIDEY